MIGKILIYTMLSEIIIVGFIFIFNLITSFHSAAKALKNVAYKEGFQDGYRDGRAEYRKRLGEAIYKTSELNSKQKDTLNTLEINIMHGNEPANIIHDWTNRK